jgi:hypothetical protein
MTAGVPYTAPRDSILTPPTMAEGLIPLSSASIAKPTGEDTRAPVLSGKHTKQQPSRKPNSTKRYLVPWLPKAVLLSADIKDLSEQYFSTRWVFAGLRMRD